MSAEEQHPLLAARPPTTDYITYLTIIEYNLSKENLPVLHEVLQDQDLTVNIGWDLVQLLLPLLPHSEPCLQVIARKGNPREVILKVTEALRLINYHEEVSDDEEVEQKEQADVPQASAAAAEASKAEVSTYAPELPLPIAQFQTLLSMLSILHPRVKTKYPSRFLSTTLQAVLASYAEATSHFGDLAGAVLSFVKTLSGTKRPHLPPRQSSSSVLQAPKDGIAEDPEAQKEQPDAAEKGLVHRLLQAFLTHLLEDYILHLRSDSDMPGLRWSSRCEEKFHPDRTFQKLSLDSTTSTQITSEQRNRSLVVSQILALARDLNIRSDELYGVILNPTPETTGLPHPESSPPSRAEEIPISKTGALFLLAGRLVAEKLLSNTPTGISLSIFPDHHSILKNYLSTSHPSNIGTEPAALLDTLLVLGIIALENGDIGEPEDDDEFTAYLQLISLLSANCPSPSLRYSAHLLTSSILRSHPSDLIRLSFIRDTLEHCPYANLKTSAVGWLKGETIEAAATSHPKAFIKRANSAPVNAADVEDTDSIFATPIALSTNAPYLFPDLRETFSGEQKGEELRDGYTEFIANLSFYLATLNFYYLLLSLPAPVQHSLGIKELHAEHDVQGRFLAPLREASKRFRTATDGGGELYEGGNEEEATADFNVLDDVLGRIERVAGGGGGAVSEGT